MKVLDSGAIQELDQPFVLLQNSEGALYKMVQQTGQAEAAALLESARQVNKSFFVIVKNWINVSELFEITDEFSSTGSTETSAVLTCDWKNNTL